MLIIIWSTVDFYFKAIVNYNAKPTCGLVDMWPHVEGPLQMWLFRSIEGLFRPLYVCICAPSPQLCFLQIFSNLTSNIPLLTCETSPQYAIFKEKYDTTREKNLK